MVKTSEYCRRGHPDRVADIMSDSIVDAYLKLDPNSRVAVDVTGTQGKIHVFGEATSKAEINETDIFTIIRGVYEEIGYKKEMEIEVNIHQQSPEINALAVEGAGDSGIMIGYATKETPELLPLETVLAKRICDKLDKSDKLLPDGKVQVTTEDGKAKKIVISYQSNEESDNYVKVISAEEVIDYLTPETEWILIQFKQGGFDSDSGLTGRKNVLWYGSSVPTGGGAFAGKDATKVDRSGAYFARKLAIKYLEAFDTVLVEIAFVIGQTTPIMLKINGKEEDCPYTVQGIIKELDLKKPIYKEASLRGHFGDKQFSWEQ